MKIWSTGIPVPFQVSDGDFDTNIYVDKNANDDDVIRFDLGGVSAITDYLTIDQTSGFRLNQGQNAVPWQFSTSGDTDLFSYDGSNDVAMFGTSNPTFVANGVTVVPKVHILDGAGNSNISLVVRSASDVATQGAFCTFVRSRGSDGAETAVQNGDRGGVFRFDNHDGTQFITGALIQGVVAGAVSTGITPKRLEFHTMDTLGVLNSRMAISPAGDVGFATLVPFALVDARGDALFNFDREANNFIVYGQPAGAAIFVQGALSGQRIRFGSSANGDLVEIWDTKTEWNRTKLNIDHSMHGQNNNNVFYLDASVDSIGFGLNNPTAYNHFRAGTATRAPIKLTAGTNLTTAQTGAMEFNGDALYFTPAGQRRAVTLSNGTITSSTSVSNTVTETTVFTETISANELHTNQRIIVDIQGRYSTVNATDTFTARLKIAGTTVATVVSDAANVTNAPLDIQFIFTVRSEGVTGSVWANTRAVFNNVNKHVASTSATTIDTTSAADVTLTIEWSSANAGNTVSVDQGGGEYNL